MDKFILLPASMLTNLLGCTLKKRINDKYEKNLFAYQFYNCVVSFSAAVCLIVFAESFDCSLYTIGMAVVFGVITLLQQLFNLYALANGPFSYTSVIISLSTLIPTLSGAIFWNEKITFVQYIGIALLVLCLIFSVEYKNRAEKTGIKWLLYSLGAFFATGIIGVMQKIHQTSEHKDELNAFLIISFAFSFFVSMLLAFVYRCKRHNKNIYSKRINSYFPVLLMLLSGIFVALNNKLNLYLSGVIDSAVFFPLVNGGGLILSSLASVVVFKEKLSKIQWIGVVIGIISVVLICNPV